MLAIAERDCSIRPGEAEPDWSPGAGGTSWFSAVCRNAYP